MSLSNLYFRCCFEQPSALQREALSSVLGDEEDSGSVVDKSCSREDINTCGISIEELFDTYPIYNPQKGLYKSWGDIEFPWEISNLTPNLLASQTDDKWRVSSYRAIVAYPEGTRVLYVEEDGFRISLYEANQDILAMSWAFDYTKWDKICHIDTTIPAGIPSLQELIERFDFYELRLFNREWEQYTEQWQTPLKETTLVGCLPPGLTLSELNQYLQNPSTEFENCSKSGSSDEWDEVRLRREFFYKEGDMFVTYGPCEDTLCLYIVTQDLSASEENLEIYQKFQPQASYWQKFYCVSTDRNKCLEYQRTKDPTLGYEVIPIGSKGHYVEKPIPYKLSPPVRTLDELVQEIPRKVLSSEEIDNLNNTLPDQNV
jgi:hypothetical protein